MGPSSPSTEIVSSTPENIVRAVDVLRGGGLVAFPTETVYGLGADAENRAAVKAVFAAKGRPADHPVIVHLAEAGLIDEWARDVPSAARVLAATFWPGPMTLILRRSARASDLVTGGLDTVGLRVPAHPTARTLLQQFGGAIAAPSANRFGRVSPTTAEHVRQGLQGTAVLILDGGPCVVGLESTIIDLTTGQPAILRPGGVTAEQIRATVERPVDGPTVNAPRAPGSLASHYAPRARVELVTADELAPRARRRLAQGAKVGVLLPANAGQDVSALDGATIIPLPADDVQQAQQLYALLRQMDELRCDVILATLPPPGGLRTAIADRLRRAAGPRAAE